MINFELPKLRIEYFEGVTERLVTFNDLVAQVQEQGLNVEVAHKTVAECSSGEYFDLDSAITKFADLSLELHEKQLLCFCDILGPQSAIVTPDAKRCGTCKARLNAKKVGIGTE